jgi:hypothetical protein
MQLYYQVFKDPKAINEGIVPFDIIGKFSMNSVQKHANISALKHFLSDVLRPNLVAARIMWLSAIFTFNNGTR